MKRARGFTLLELMIVVTVVAILAGFAINAYTKQIRKSRRAEALQYLMEASLLQEKYRTNNATYATCAQLFGSAANCTTAQNRSAYYTLNYNAITPTATAYSFTAAPKAAQVGDTCGTYTFALNAGTLAKTSTANDPPNCF